MIDAESYATTSESMTQAESLKLEANEITNQEQDLSDNVNAEAATYLTLQQAAAVLGKSLRALERSILGKWGNKLPDGWQAKQVMTGQGWRWCVIPPPDFKIPEQILHQSTFSQLVNNNVQESLAANLDPSADTPQPAWLSNVEHQAIIIDDHKNEVEYLLKELVKAQTQLAEERRERMQDWQLMTQMQGSLRLLEVKTNETNKIKEELKAVQEEFSQIKDKYLNLINMSWWKRIFYRQM